MDLSVEVVDVLFEKVSRVWVALSDKTYKGFGFLISGFFPSKCFSPRPTSFEFTRKRTSGVSVRLVPLLPSTEFLS